jgi:CYTH domain-containing protein
VTNVNGLEIERKYLVHPRALMVLAAETYERAKYTNKYFVLGEIEVRLHRSKSGNWILTFKEGLGQVRKEVEAFLDESEAMQLQAITHCEVSKTRIWLPDEWSVDVYHAPYTGLVTAERETLWEDQEVSIPPILKSAGVQEVTGSRILANQRLAEFADQPVSRDQVFTFAEDKLGLPADFYKKTFHSEK